MQPRYALTWVIYGLIVVASGCYRWFSRPDGEKGLYFGLVRGALALAAAALLRFGRARVGNTAGSISVLFVLGWCVFESMIKNGGSHEPRLLIVAGISLVQLGIAVSHLRGKGWS